VRCFGARRRGEKCQNEVQGRTERSWPPFIWAERREAGRQEVTRGGGVTSILRPVTGGEATDRHHFGSWRGRGGDTIAQEATMVLGALAGEVAAASIPGRRYGMTWGGGLDGLQKARWVG
jgi:hypothetical protein